MVRIRTSQFINGIHTKFAVIASTRRQQVRNCTHIVTFLAVFPPKASQQSASCL